MLIPQAIVEVAGSGGGAEDPIFDTFGTADHSYEFDGTSIAALTALGAPDFSAEVAGQYLIREDGSTYRGVYKNGLTAPWTAIAKISDRLPFAVDGVKASLIIATTTPGEMDGLVWGNSDRAIWLEHMSAPDGTGASNVVAGIASTQVTAPVYLMCVVNANNDVDYYFALNGYVWRTVTTARDLSTFSGGVKSAGVGIVSAGGNVHSASFDFLRIWDSALVLP